MGTKLTKEEKGILADLQAEVYRVTSNGTRNFVAVRRGLQDIIEGKFLVGVNSSIASVERQLEVWKHLGVAISGEQWERILQQADMFEPFTDTDEPLVTGGFGYDNPTTLVSKLFGVLTPPDGYTKVNYIQDAKLRYAPGMQPTGGLRLVHYDPNAYSGLSPEAALKAAKRDKLRLAGIEVLEHLVLNPRTSLTWDGKLYFFPNLSGFQCGPDWSRVPYVYRWGGGRRLRLDDGWAGGGDPDWSSPSVRDCS